MSSFGEEAQRRAPCPNCGREQRVSTLYEHINEWDYDDGMVSGTNEYYVFRCKGCETVIFCQSSAHSEERVDYYNRQGKHITEYPFKKTYWPVAPKIGSNRLPLIDLLLIHENTSNLLRQVYIAIDSNLNVLAAIGARTTFDAASEYLGIDQDLSFEEKLEMLRTQAYISGKEKGTLEVLINAGSAAAHRGWAPTGNELDTIIKILNGFIDTNMLRPCKVNELKGAIPNRS